MYKGPMSGERTKETEIALYILYLISVAWEGPETTWLLWGKKDRNSVVVPEP